MAHNQGELMARDPPISSSPLPTMGRTRTKKKLQTKATNHVVETQGPSIPGLLEKAQSLIEQCDYELALRFARRVLEKDQKNTEAKELLGVALLEIGDIKSARDVCMIF